MAEQDSHNVVIQSESASGSVPLVDAARNHISTPSVLAGSKPNTSNSSHTIASLADDPTGSQPPQEQLAPKIDADPSAGNVATRGANTASLERVQETANTSSENTALLDASAEQSAGSDNEAGKGDNVDAVKDGTQHSRTNSVKRPATFSKVSVTKNFLAKSATAAPVVVKNGDKSAPAVMAAPAALKPRLVAKSATLSNVARARNGADSSPGPDAGTVWNKNRPAPAIPAKQFTDEELKQQYGIHLATRLQTDENGKGSKWADIDDDEDDWAPDTVVWMDGTKSSLTSAETLAVSSLPKSTSPAPVIVAEAPKPSLTAMKKPGETSGAVKTILKPGAAAQAKQQAGQDTSTASSEKQLLKTSAPSKSPWATLPPVDKVAPISSPINAPPSHPAPFVSQDVRVSEMASSAGFPAREIAADTFDRSWREGEGERRELFNSSSGKYEPAPEGRRNSIKHDGFGRKPVVLSRASGYGDSGHQARTSGMDGSYFSHQRRGSSVSHGSGPSARRMSYSKGSDSVISDHQTGFNAGHDMRPTPIFQQSPWQQQLPPPPAAVEEGEDPVKIQERVMREKRTAARQRRQDEEAREEAAKQERLKSKLDSLAGAGQSRKERQQIVAEPASEQSAPDAPPSAEQPKQPECASIEEAAAELSAEVAGSDQFPTDASAAEQKSVVSPSLFEATPADVSPRVHTQEHLSPSTASRTTFQSQNPGPYRTAQTSSFSSPGDRDRKLQPFRRSPVVNHDTFSPWPSAGSSSNVWGVSGIGNGTFEGGSLFAPMANSQQISSLPPPPGMSRPGTSARISPQGLGQASHSPSMQEAQLAEQRTLPSTMGQPRGNGMPSQGMGRQQHGPGPIGPPSRAQPQHQNMAGRGEGVSAWQSAAQRLSGQFGRDTDTAVAQQVSEDAPVEQSRGPIFKETFRQTTGLQGRLGGPRIFDKTEYTIHDPQGSHSVSSPTTNPVPPNAQSQPSGPDVTSSPLQQWRQPVESAVRLPDGSLNPAHGGKAQRQQPPIAPPTHAALPKSSSRKPHFTTAPLAPAPAFSNDSPPPPETTSHPVYTGFTHHPHVRLPPPPPVVKLPPPPAASVHMTPPGMMSQRPLQNWSHMGNNQPIVKNGEWQARFNGLFNRAPIQTEVPPSPPKTPPKAFAPVLAVACSSRPPLDDAIISATVSLPRAAARTKALFAIDDSSSVVSKTALMFTDELGFGSRPRVRVPRNYQSPGFHVHGAATKHGEPMPVDAESRRNMALFHQFYKRPDGYYMKLSGLSRSKFVPDLKHNLHIGKANRSQRDAPARKDTHAPTSDIASTSPSSSKPSVSRRNGSAADNTLNKLARRRSGQPKPNSKPSSTVPVNGN